MENPDTWNECIKFIDKVIGDYNSQDPTTCGCSLAKTLFVELVKGGFIANNEQQLVELLKTRGWRVEKPRPIISPFI